MTEEDHNLLTRPLIHATPCGTLTLQGLLAALSHDEVESYPALRPHQRPAWHMFLVQLAALALHRAGETQLPPDEQGWLRLLRGLTPDFPDDEPWRLTVADWSKPAFLQPPVPDGGTLSTEVPSADALDLLITSRNHDLKQSIARRSEAQDWIFALVSLQTTEGFGGRENYGIARMNGGHASRPFLGLAPRELSSTRTIATRPGAHIVRDVRVLLETRSVQRERYSHLQYPETGGLGLTWLAPWPEGEQLQLQQLDLWFIEVCRRIRLNIYETGFTARRGKSNAARIKDDHLKGVLGDPWMPIHKVENKSFTLGKQGFNHRTLTDLLLSGAWELPVLARPASFDGNSDQQILFAQSLVRGQNKTEGFKSRLLPIGGKIMRMLSLEAQREKLHKLAQDQLAEIKFFGDAISYTLQLYAAKGNKEELAEKLKSHKSREKLYAFTTEARAQLDWEADQIFFDHLWARFETQDRGAERTCFAKVLHQKAEAIFEAALPSIPCSSIFRPRAEARARSAFRSAIWKHFPELFAKEQLEETAHADA